MSSRRVRPRTRLRTRQRTGTSALPHTKQSARTHTGTDDTQTRIYITQRSEEGCTIIEMIEK